MKPKITAHELFERVQGAWDDARGQRAIPRRQDVDAVKIGALLPYVGLIDVVHGERIDLRFRLVGGQTTLNYGLDLTGYLHSQRANPELPSRFYEICVLCATSATTQSLTIDNGRNHKQLPFKVEARIWPLSDDGKLVTGLLGAALFQAPDFSKPKAAPSLT